VYQILEVDDEWNILKCTLHWTRIQEISITLATLKEFLVISTFHETRISTMDMKVQVYSKFSKKLGNKWNLQAPWRMEDFTLPSIGASFIKWSDVHPFSQNPWPMPHNTRKKIKIKMSKNWKRGPQPADYQTMGRGCPPGPHGCPKLLPFNIFILPSCPHIFAHVVNSC
jgi:hypothetical protein